MGGFWLAGGWMFVWLVGWLVGSFVGCFTPYFNTDQDIPWRLVTLASAPDFPSFYILTRQGTDCLISCVSFEGSSLSSSYACLSMRKQFMILYDIIYCHVYHLV